MTGSRPDDARTGFTDMTPFGARLRMLRTARGMTAAQLAGTIQVSPAYLSALEHGHRGAPSSGLVHQVCEAFGLIWDEADELARLARLSHPRVTVDTAGLAPEQTALANRLAQAIHRIPPAAAARLHAMIDEHLVRDPAPNDPARPARTRHLAPKRDGRPAPAPDRGTDR